MTVTRSRLLDPENSLTLVRGSSKTYLLSVTDKNSRPVDLTGARLYFSVKARVEDVEPVVKKSTAVLAEIAVTDAKGGKAEIYLQSTDTSKLDTKQYVFDVWVVLSSGKKYPVVAPSTFEVLPGVTVLS